METSGKLMNVKKYEQHGYPLGTWRPQKYIYGMLYKSVPT